MQIYLHLLYTGRKLDLFPGNLISRSNHKYVSLLNFVCIIYFVSISIYICFVCALEFRIRVDMIITYSSEFIKVSDCKWVHSKLYAQDEIC